MPDLAGGEKEGMRIAPAVAGGELQRQLAKVGQRTLLRTWKQRLVLFELCSGPQAKGWYKGQNWAEGDEGIWGLGILPHSSTGKKRS